MKATVTYCAAALAALRGGRVVPAADEGAIYTSCEQVREPLMLAFRSLVDVGLEALAAQGMRNTG